jgi:hypothetical protein
MLLKITAAACCAMLLFAASPAAYAAKGTCYSARKCTGKILNRSTPKGCKKSGGHSWKSRAGVCIDL